MIRIAFFEPRIAANTGNAIRLAAATGAELHLIEPLGFDLTDSKLRRAGLDYHDLASVTVHADLADFLATVPEVRVFAFSARATQVYTTVTFRDGDVLLFGPEPTGLPAEVLGHDRVAASLRIPMLSGRRSLNLANCAAIATYEAWRQLDHSGAGPR